MSVRQTPHRIVSGFHSIALFFSTVAVGFVGGCGTGTSDEPDAAARELMWEVQDAFEQADYLRTLALVDSALGFLPDYAPLHFVQARVLTKLYRFDEAEATYERTLALQPGYPAASFNLGNNAFFLGRHRQALRHYERELSRGTLDDEARSLVDAQIGRVFARLVVADSARKAFEASLSVREADAQTWAWLAQLSEDEGELNQALSEARRAFGIEPENIEYQYLVGALAFKTGALEEAEGHLRAVALAAPWHAGAHYNLGRCLLTIGREAEAQAYLVATDRLQELDRAIILAKYELRMDPRDVIRWRNLASLYERSGRRKDAAEAWAIAMQVGQ